MAYDVIPEVGEEMALRLEFTVSPKVAPFHFAISDRAIYIPRTKLIAKTDPFYFERVPLDQVRHINVRRLRPYGLWLLAPIMILAGLVTSWALIETLDTPGIHHVSGWPIALIVGGCLIPVAAKGRYGLEIWFAGGKFRWKPPLVVDGASKKKIADTFSTIIAACQKVGAPVLDNRFK